MAKILGIAGSLRKASYNAASLRVYNQDVQAALTGAAP